MNKTFRKIVGGALAVTALMGLAACGNGNSSTPSQSSGGASSSGTTSSSATEISLWSFNIGGFTEASNWDSLIAAFNEANPDIKVTVTPINYQDGDQKLTSAITSGSGPDIIFEGPERIVGNYAREGLMVDLGDVWGDASADIGENISSVCQLDGTYYMYPLSAAAHCMAINKTVFEAAGAMQYVDAENHTWTTDNFLKAVQAVYDSGKTDVGAIYCSGQGGDQGTRAIINNMYGGTFTDAAHTKYTADSAENIKAIQTLHDADGINFDASINGGEEITLFRNGTLQMAFCWNIAQQTNADNSAAGTTNSGDDILFMAFPTESGDPALCGGIWGFGVFDNGDENKIAASKTFINFMANSDETAKAVKTSTYFSVKNSLSDLYKDDEVMNEYQKLMPYLGDYYQVTPGWAEARTAWWNMLQQVGQGTDVTTAVTEFCNTANAAASAS
mgnify:CR=1 FL=1